MGARRPTWTGQEEDIRSGWLTLLNLALSPQPQVELRPPAPPGASISHLALQILYFQLLLLQVPLLLGYLVEELLNPAVLGLELSLGERGKQW